jgi:hypothetical protein
LTAHFAKGESSWILPIPIGQTWLPNRSKENFGRYRPDQQKKIGACANGKQSGYPIIVSPVLTHWGITMRLPIFCWKAICWKLADLNIQEVNYYVIDQKGKRKDFCAAGWQNENGGWEVRAQKYSGCIGTKGMTFIPGSQSVLAIFPEYVDFLKRRNDEHLYYASILILNHPEFLSAALKRASHFEKVLSYIDDMRQGYQSTREVFKDKLLHAEVKPL